ncbi:DUF3365 domain-containing protein [Flavobacterium sp.]|jgi:cytochrome c553|uniref:DUF3365 domain-containing protein n=1 Tax=Flavobacterium sp. TaxID=239 RepID=UPI0037BF2376
MKSSIFIVVVLSLVSCQKKVELLEIPKDLTEVEAQEAQQLMATHCYICHSPTASETEGRIAPPMVAIKARYLMNNATKEEFVSHITQFVENPTTENAIMYGAVDRFNVMPKQVFPEGVVQKIANYMFDYQIVEPSWFKEHWESSGNGQGRRKGKGEWLQSGKKLGVAEKTKTYEEIGLEYALATKAVLGKNLMGTIQSKGTKHAMEFCNAEAIPLTDSMSTYYNAKIKRVSDKNRNPNNKANAEELNYIAQFKADAVAKRESKPVVIEKGNQVQFYYPIPTNTMCLQCHGTQVKPEVTKQILKLYPNDLAVGYGENEVRGIWSITFEKK